ncbi:MAG: glutamate--tRNA ligase [Candidatus Spechtbacteria bacterium]|nr:glutamate--tRNA ligase [Candidatus Spechtbacteria bacterium]
MSVRVRIAPSPTGLMHVGTARTALFNWLFAKKNSGVFVLRIEDTDKERSKNEYEENIIEGLEWLGLDYQEFYRQSERTEIYANYIKKLLDSGSAFYCYHSPEELEREKDEQMAKKLAPRHKCDGESGIRNPAFAKAMAGRQESGIIRFKNPGGKVKFYDLIRGEIEFDSGLFGDFSIAKDEHTPLYNLAAAIDDCEMKISHVIRGEDHISNTPKQLLIYQALGLVPPKYAHLPMILGTDKSKLSKRHGAAALTEYRAMGYLPDAMFNFLVFLGWNPGNEKEILSREEITEQFSLERVQKSGAVFNIEKLDWMNGQYIRKTPIDELTKLSLPYLASEGKKSEIDGKKSDFEEFARQIVALEQLRLTKLSQIAERTEFFFKDTLMYDKELLKWKAMNNEEVKETLEKLEELLGGIPEKVYTKEKLEEILMAEAQKIGDRGKLLWPLRVALTGRKASPGPFEVAEILGKKKCLARLREAKRLL